VIDKNTGCFNATKLCKNGKKDFSQWKRLERVQELISFYENKSRPGDPQGGYLADEVEEVNAKLSQFIFNYVKRGRKTDRRAD